MPASNPSRASHRIGEGQGWDQKEKSCGDLGGFGDFGVSFFANTAGPCVCFITAETGGVARAWDTRRKSVLQGARANGFGARRGLPTFHSTGRPVLLGPASQHPG